MVLLLQRPDNEITSLNTSSSSSSSNDSSNNIHHGLTTSRSRRMNSNSTSRLRDCCTGPYYVDSTGANTAPASLPLRKLCCAHCLTSFERQDHAVETNHDEDGDDEEAVCDSTSTSSSSCSSTSSSRSLEASFRTPNSAVSTAQRCVNVALMKLLDSLEAKHDDDLAKRYLDDCSAATETTTCLAPVVSPNFGAPARCPKDFESATSSDHAALSLQHSLVSALRKKCNQQPLRKANKCIGNTRRRVRGLWNSQSSLFADLYDETMLHILTFLPMNDVLQASLVNRRWNHVATMEEVWKHIDATDFVQQTYANCVKRNPKTASQETTRRLNEQLQKHQPESLTIRSIERCLNADSFHPPMKTLKRLTLSGFAELSDTHVHVMLLSLAVGGTAGGYERHDLARAVIKQQCALRHLALEHCSRLTDACLRSVSLQCPHLQHLSLRGNPKIISLEFLKNSFKTVQKQDASASQYHHSSSTWAPLLANQAQQSAAPPVSAPPSLQSLFRGPPPAPPLLKTAPTASSSLSVSSSPSSSGLASLFVPNISSSTSSLHATSNRNAHTLAATAATKNLQGHSATVNTSHSSGLTGFSAPPPPKPCTSSSIPNLSSLNSLFTTPLSTPASRTVSSPTMFSSNTPTCSDELFMKTTASPSTLSTLFAPPVAGADFCAKNSAQSLDSMPTLTHSVPPLERSTSPISMPPDPNPSSSQSSCHVAAPSRSSPPPPPPPLVTANLSSLFAPPAKSMSALSVTQETTIAQSSTKSLQPGATTLAGNSSTFTLPVKSASFSCQSSPLSPTRHARSLSLSAEPNNEAESPRSSGLTDLFAVPGTSPRRSTPRTFAKPQLGGLAGNTHSQMSVGKLCRLDISGTNVTPTNLIKSLKQACGEAGKVQLQRLIMHGSGELWRDVDCVELRTIVQISKELDVACTNTVAGAIGLTSKGMGELLQACQARTMQRVCLAGHSNLSASSIASILHAFQQLTDLQLEGCCVRCVGGVVSSLFVSSSKLSNNAEADVAALACALTEFGRKDAKSGGGLRRLSLAHWFSKHSQDAQARHSKSLIDSLIRSPSSQTLNELDLRGLYGITNDVVDMIRANCPLLWKLDVDGSYAHATDL